MIISRKTVWQITTRKTVQIHPDSIISLATQIQQGLYTSTQIHTHPPTAAVVAAAAFLRFVPNAI